MPAQFYASLNPVASVKPAQSANGGSQTPWLQDVDAAGYSLDNVGALTANLLNTDTIKNALGITLNTNAFDRVVIDAAGHCTFHPADDLAPSLIAMGGVQFGDGSVQITAVVASAQTPWISDIDAAGFGLSNVSALAVNGDVNVTGSYQRNGVPIEISNQTDVTGSRALGAVYQNNTGKTLFILITLNLASKAADVSFLTDASNPPGTVITRISDDSNAAVTNNLFAMVLPGNYYECAVNSGTPGITIWVEYS